MAPFDASLFILANQSLVTYPEGWHKLGLRSFSILTSHTDLRATSLTPPLSFHLKLCISVNPQVVLEPHCWDESVFNITHPITMANIKLEDTDNNLVWHGYNLQTPTSNSAHPTSLDSYYSHNLAQKSYHEGKRGSQCSIDIPSIHRRPPPQRRECGTENITASPLILDTNYSSTSLKRAFQDTEESTHGEVFRDFKDEKQDVAKPAINQDHRLLSFTRLPDKHTIIDEEDRVQQIELAAKLHGMFFLSDLATPSAEGRGQPELTCYRRNLFQISGIATTPRGSMTVLTEHGERVPIVSLEVCISAKESVDGQDVKLIVIPWKTPPPNSPEVGTGQEHEPLPIPLRPCDEGNPDVTSENSVYSIAYRRLQFRIATANNGRRRELQQHFTLYLNVVGTLANGNKAIVCETSTTSIVVRGRSPRSFQARKEIPLVGSSSSRGQPPELRVSTTLQTNPVATEEKPKVKPQSIELPRSPFTFDPGNNQGSPSLFRLS